MINDMLESVKEILGVYGRIITLVPLLLIVIIVMGKRSISELPVFDFIIIITLGVEGKIRPNALGLEVK
jgi:uncharacterized membrane protein YcaP (DUF421 family)